MERRTHLTVLALIFALGAYLRLVDLTGPSLWLDEIIHLQVTRSLADEPWYQHALGVSEVAGVTENGPLYYRLQIWGQKLAPGELGVRLFPAIVGILTLPLMAVTARRIGGPHLAVVATLLLAVSPLHVYFSREGRPYYLLMTLTLWLLYALLQRGSRTGTALAVSGCLLSAYVGIQCLPVLMSFAVLSTGAALGDLRRRRSAPSRDRLAALQAPAAACVALALAFGLYMTRSDVNSPLREKAPAQAKVEKSPLYQSPVSQRSLSLLLASMTTSGHPTRSLEPRSWLLLALAIAGLLAGLRRRSLGTVLTVGMFLLPTVLSLAALVSVSRWYGIRYTSAGLLPFLLLTAMGLVALAERIGQRLAKRASRRQVAAWVTSLAVALLLVAPNLEAARQDPFRKLDWRGVAQFFDAIALDDEPVLIPNGWPQLCLDHYLQELDRSVEFVTIWESAELGEQAVTERQRGWLLTAGFRRTNEVRAWMHRFVSVLKKPEEELDLFFFPDFKTLFETRFAAGKGAVFTQRFAEMGQRFEFVEDERLLKGQGWSYPERNDTASFQWAVGSQAELGLPVDLPADAPPSDATLRLRVLPYLYPEAPPQNL
ncbi:MAG: glycosyltransferase family 39 protein, partial [Acidobacteriota bacterium]